MNTLNQNSMVGVLTYFGNNQYNFSSCTCDGDTCDTGCGCDDPNNCSEGCEGTDCGCDDPGGIFECCGCDDPCTYDI